jgi:hypothetical protein
MANFVDGQVLTAAQLNQAFADSLSEVSQQFGQMFATWFASLPTTLPAQAGAFWNDNGTLARS